MYKEIVNKNLRGMFLSVCVLLFMVSVNTEEGFSRDMVYDSHVDPPIGTMATGVKKDVTIAWEAVDDAEGYLVYEAKGKNGKFNKIGETYQCSFVAEKRNRGEIYRYFVRACKWKGKKFAYGKKSKVVETTVPITGVSTVKNLLRTGLAPMGNTMYVWGGGWHLDDAIWKNKARQIGTNTAWREFAMNQGSDYNYKNFQYKRLEGLDCSGFIGFCIYNIMNTEENNESYVISSKKMAKNFYERGWGKYVAKNNIETYVAGDIMSRITGKGHVWMVVGDCSDGSVVVMHSSPKGVRLSGTATKEGDRNSEATALAEKYMKRYFPDWYRKYPGVMTNTDYLENYNQFKWNADTLSDPDDYREMWADEILKDLFNENK